jgi:hypothetical protein
MLYRANMHGEYAYVEIASYLAMTLGDMAQYESLLFTIP